MIGIQPKRDRLVFLHVTAWSSGEDGCVCLAHTAMVSIGYAVYLNHTPSTLPTSEPDPSIPRISLAMELEVNRSARELRDILVSDIIEDIW
jgi:hypothetical protein